MNTSNALALLDSKNIASRDIKLQNIMIDEKNNNFKIIDFNEYKEFDTVDRTVT